MKMMLTLSPAPLAALELDDLQAVSGGSAPATVTGDPSKDSTVTRAAPDIAEILRREAENKLGGEGDKK
jgi:hypothetical protein